ncbi:MAG: peptidylprolyl isomerase, partial [Anaerolineae bacterium]|nr:peptidylprolyl isomerase [Anaerolineae bacterium]
RTRHEREAAIQRLVLLAVGIIGALAIVLVAFALINDQLLAPRQPVASVNGETITVSDFERRVRLERTLLNEQLSNAYYTYLSFGASDQEAQQALTQNSFTSSIISEMQVPDQLGNRVLNDMIDDTLIRQQAQALGITVSEEQVQERIQQFFGYDPNAGLLTATPSPSPTSSPTPFITATPSPIPTETLVPTITPTPEVTATASVTPQATATATSTPDAATREAVYNSTREDFFTYVINTSQINDADLQAYFEAQTLREAVQEHVTSEMAHTATYANVRHILVATEAEAQDVLEALQAGESFANLAAAVSTDTSNAGNGGELGWAPLARYVAPFADAVRDAEIGAFVGPVETEFGYHILQVRAREEREMSDSDFEQSKARQFQDWLDGIHAEQSASIETFDTWIDNVPTDPPLSLRTS